MRLTIKNLGPIKEGTLDLHKELTILTGPNNTGKSYITYLIYGITQHAAINGIPQTVESIENILNSVESLSKLIESSQPVKLTDLFLDILNALSELITNNIQANLSKIFASPIFNSTINITLPTPNFISKSSSLESMQFFGTELTLITHDGNMHKDPRPNIFKRVNPHELAIDSITVWMFGTLESLLYQRTYFFPAERTAINLFARHITSTKAEIKDNLDAEVVAGMSDEALVRLLRTQVGNAPKYPYAIRDYINFVNEFQQEQTTGEFTSIASNIESILAGGSVHLNEFNQLIYIPQDSNQSLELHLSSSLVKSLSYLILYLRYTAKKGDQIIIDEPELNLHPDLQLAIAKVIAEMVNAGLKVIISTHSDYLIKELNNLVLLYDLNETETGQVFVREKGYNSTQLLNKEQVGAYYLNDNTITAIDVEATGIEVPSINDTINAIDSLTEEILYQL